MRQGAHPIDYDSLRVLQKVELFERSLTHTAGMDLYKVIRSGIPGEVTLGGLGMKHLASGSLVWPCQVGGPVRSIHLPLEDRLVSHVGSPLKWGQSVRSAG